MPLDTRWKNPQGSDAQNMYLWAQDLIKELRKGDYLNTFLTSTAGGIPGTTTNDDADAGDVGEYKHNETDNVALVTSVAKTITSFTLTPGDWDVAGSGLFTPDATTTVTAISISISLVNNTLGSFPGGNNQTFQVDEFFVGDNQGIVCGPTRVSIAADTIVYLVAQSSFAVSTMEVNGFIRARRMR